MAVRYAYVRAHFGNDEADRIGRPLLQSRQACGSNEACIEQAQLKAIKAYGSLGAPVAPPITASVASNSVYVVDGMPLGARVQVDSSIYQKYNCTPSENFSGLTWCHKEETKKEKHDEVTFSNSILHTADGVAWYINRYIEPAHFDPGEIKAEINRLSAKFGQTAHVMTMPEQQGLPDAIIAVWGAVQLEPIDSQDIAVVAAGGSPHRGILVSFLGDLQRAAKAGVPVYSTAGGAGFVLAATYNHKGDGVLRFFAIDASQIALSEVLSNNPPQPQPVPNPNGGPPSNPLPPRADLPPTAPMPAKPLPTDDPFKTDCDEYSASNTDPQRKGAGVPLDEIVPAKAIPACLNALKDYPNSVRFQYQLGRAYERSGELDQAKTWYGKAADHGSQEAKEILNRLAAQH